MNFTAAQRRLVETDEKVREKERAVATDPGDGQNALAYAVEYLRNNPELAKQAGINAFTPQDIQGIRKCFNDLLEMMRWISDRTDDFTFWGSFPGEFPVKTLSSEADPNDPDDYYSGGWARIDEVAEELEEILTKQNPGRRSGILGSNDVDRI